MLRLPGVEPRELAVSGARAVACSNIALVKYWGKADVERNLPAVPSLSMTLDGLRTVTTVAFSATLTEDVVSIGGSVATGKPRDRAVALLERVRALAGVPHRARVESANDFPTAAGLASSASGFAALALAAVAAAGREVDLSEVSALARSASASAARSVYGGYAALGAGAERAERVASAADFPLAMLVAVTATGPKSLGSTEAMTRTAQTSPYYRAWVEGAPALFEQARSALLSRDLRGLGEAMEQSTLQMHATMHTSVPAVVYWVPATLSAMACVTELRTAGVPAYFTIDGGPHVKVLTSPEHADEVRAKLTGAAGVLRVLSCTPGPDAFVEETWE